MLTQFVGYGGLALIALAVLAMSGVQWRRWPSYVWRARWLLVTLWLILAFNTPGEAWLDYPWAPTEEGIAEANLQVLRLVVMLGCLTWLMARMGLDGLVAGLWFLLNPLAALGLATERLVVRLSLVLDNLQLPMEKGAWRRMLAPDYVPQSSGPALMHLEVRAWGGTDTVISLLSLAVAVGVMWR